MIHFTKIFKDTLVIFTLQLLSPITLDIINLHSFTEIVQMFSYAASAGLSLTSTLKVGEGSAGFGLCARLWRKPTEPLTVLYVDVKAL